MRLVLKLAAMSCLLKCIRVRSYWIFDRLRQIAQLAFPSNIQPLPQPGVDRGGIGGLPADNPGGDGWQGDNAERSQPSSPPTSRTRRYKFLTFRQLSARGPISPLLTRSVNPRATPLARIDLCYRKFSATMPCPPSTEVLLRRTALRRRQHCTSSTQPASQSLTLCKIYMLT